MVVQCEQVWLEVSDYLDRQLDPDLQVAIDRHVQACTRCLAVVSGVRNVVSLYGDDRMMELPFGFSTRLRHRLEQTMPLRRGTAMGWTVGFALAAVILASFQVGRASSWRWPQLRDRLAQPAQSIPLDMTVVVSTDGKVFHVAGCRFIHDPAHVRTLTAGEALKQGYSPCIRCMRKYLITTASAAMAESQAASEEQGEE